MNGRFDKVENEIMMIENERKEEIFLRRFVMGDTEKIFQMSQENSLARFLPDQVYQNQEEAAKVLEFLISTYSERVNQEDKPFVLGVILKNSNELIGHIGVSTVEAGIEIGYAIEVKHQGLGYAKIAVSKMLQILGVATDIKEVYGIVDPQNIPSIKVLEKCGFAQIGSKQKKLVYKKELVRQTT